MNRLAHDGAETKLGVLLNKVPEITLYFWIIKIMATTVGETAADFLIFNAHVGLGGTSLLMSGLLAAVLTLQMRERRYIPWLYWVSVVLISIVGTLVTDNLTDHFGVPLELTTIGFALALAATFALWFASERTLSIHTVYSGRREAFYWAAILLTFALGTAAGDLAAETIGLGYGPSALIFSSLIALVVFAYRVLNLNAVVAFWVAYILTRPMGASFGDLLSQPVSNGGLGFGTVSTSAVFLVIILALVAYLTATRLDTATPSINEGN